MIHKKVKKLMAFQESHKKELKLKEPFENYRDGEFRADRGNGVWFFEKEKQFYSKAIMKNRSGRKIELLRSKTVSKQFYSMTEEVFERDQASAEIIDFCFLDFINEPNVISLIKRKVKENFYETLFGENILHIKPICMQKQRGKLPNVIKNFNTFLINEVSSQLNGKGTKDQNELFVLTGSYYSDQFDELFLKLDSCFCEFEASFDQRYLKSFIFPQRGSKIQNTFLDTSTQLEKSAISNKKSMDGTDLEMLKMLEHLRIICRMILTTSGKCDRLELASSLLVEIYKSKKNSNTLSKPACLSVNYYGLEYTKIIPNEESVYFHAMFSVAFGEYHSKKPKLMAYINKQGEYLLKGGEYEASKDQKEVKKAFSSLTKKFLRALQSFKLSKDLQNLIFDYLTAILLLSNLKIKETSTDQKAQISSKKINVEGEKLEFREFTPSGLIASFLKLEEATVLNFLTTRREEKKSVRISRKEAIYRRDYLCKELYKMVVDIIISYINFFFYVKSERSLSTNAESNNKKEKDKLEKEKPSDSYNDFKKECEKVNFLSLKGLDLMIEKNSIESFVVNYQAQDLLFKIQKQLYKKRKLVNPMEELFEAEEIGLFAQIEKTTNLVSSGFDSSKLNEHIEKNWPFDCWGHFAKFNQTPEAEIKLKISVNYNMGARVDYDLQTLIYRNIETSGESYHDILFPAAEYLIKMFLSSADSAGLSHPPKNTEELPPPASIAEHFLLDVTFMNDIKSQYLKLGILKKREGKVAEAKIKFEEEQSKWSTVLFKATIAKLRDGEEEDPLRFDKELSPLRERIDVLQKALNNKSFLQSFLDDSKLLESKIIGKKASFSYHLLSSADMIQEYIKQEVILQIRFYMLVPQMIKSKKLSKLIITGQDIDNHEHFNKTKKRRFMFQCEKFVTKINHFHLGRKTVLAENETIKVFPNFYKHGFECFLHARSSLEALIDYLNRRIVFHRFKICYLRYQLLRIYANLQVFGVKLMKILPRILKRIAFNNIYDQNSSELKKKMERSREAYNQKVFTKFIECLIARRERVTSMGKRYYMNLLSSLASSDPKIKEKARRIAKILKMATNIKKIISGLTFLTIKDNVKKKKTQRSRSARKIQKFFRGFKVKAIKKSALTNLCKLVSNKSRISFQFHVSQIMNFLNAKAKSEKKAFEESNRRLWERQLEAGIKIWKYWAEFKRRLLKKFVINRVQSLINGVRKLLFTNFFWKLRANNEKEQLKQEKITSARKIATFLKKQKIRILESLKMRSLMRAEVNLGKIRKENLKRLFSSFKKKITEEKDRKKFLISNDNLFLNESQFFSNSQFFAGENHSISNIFQHCENSPSNSFLSSLRVEGFKSGNDPKKLTPGDFKEYISLSSNFEDSKMNNDIEEVWSESKNGKKMEMQEEKLITFEELMGEGDNPEIKPELAKTSSKSDLSPPAASIFDKLGDIIKKDTSQKAVLTTDPKDCNLLNPKLTPSLIQICSTINGETKQQGFNDLAFDKKTSEAALIGIELNTGDRIRLHITSVSDPITTAIHKAPDSDPNKSPNPVPSESDPNGRTPISIISESDPNKSFSNINKSLSDPNILLPDPNKSLSDPNQSFLDPSKSPSDPNKSPSDPNKLLSYPNISVSDPNKSLSDPNKSFSDPNKSITYSNLLNDKEAGPENSIPKKDLVLGDEVLGDEVLDGGVFPYKEPGEELSAHCEQFFGDKKNRAGKYDVIISRNQVISPCHSSETDPNALKEDQEIKARESDFDEINGEPESVQIVVIENHSEYKSASKSLMGYSANEREGIHNREQYTPSRNEIETASDMKLYETQPQFIGNIPIDISPKPNQGGGESATSCLNTEASVNDIRKVNELNVLKEGVITSENSNICSVVDSSKKELLSDSAINSSNQKEKKANLGQRQLSYSLQTKKNPYIEKFGKLRNFFRRKHNAQLILAFNKIDFFGKMNQEANLKKSFAAVAIQKAFKICLRRKMTLGRIKLISRNPWKKLDLVLGNITRCSLQIFFTNIKAISEEFKQEIRVKLAFRKFIFYLPVFQKKWRKQSKIGNPSRTHIESALKKIEPPPEVNLEESNKNISNAGKICAQPENTTIEKPYDPKIVQKASCSTTIQTTSGLTTNQRAIDPIKIQKAGDPTTIQKTINPPTIHKVNDPSTIQKASGPTIVQKASGPTTIQKASGLTIIQKASGLTTGQKVSDPNSIQKASDHSTARKAGDSMIIQKANDPPTINKYTDPTTIKTGSDSSSNQKASSIKKVISRNTNLKNSLDGRENIGNTGAPTQNFEASHMNEIGSNQVIEKGVKIITNSGSKEGKDRLNLNPRHPGVKAFAKNIIQTDVPVPPPHNKINDEKDKPKLNQTNNASFFNLKSSNSAKSLDPHKPKLFSDFKSPQKQHEPNDQQNKSAEKTLSVEKIIIKRRRTKEQESARDKTPESKISPIEESPEELKDTNNSGQISHRSLEKDFDKQAVPSEFMVTGLLPDKTQGLERKMNDVRENRNTQISKSVSAKESVKHKIEEQQQFSRSQLFLTNKNFKDEKSDRRNLSTEPIPKERTNIRAERKENKISRIKSESHSEINGGGPKFQENSKRNQRSPLPKPTNQRNPSPKIDVKLEKNKDRNGSKEGKAGRMVSAVNLKNLPVKLKGMELSWTRETSTQQQNPSTNMNLISNASKKVVRRNDSSQNKLRARPDKKEPTSKNAISVNKVESCSGHKKGGTKIDSESKAKLKTTDKQKEKVHEEEIKVKKSLPSRGVADFYEKILKNDDELMVRHKQFMDKIKLNLSIPATKEGADDQQAIIVNKQLSERMLDDIQNKISILKLDTNKFLKEMK